MAGNRDSESVDYHGDYSDSDSEYNSLPVPSLKSKTVVPPIGFGMVATDIYRSGHPFDVNFGLLEKLNIKTIIYLAAEDYPPENIAWCASHDVLFYQYHQLPVRDPAPTNDSVAIEAALKIVKDRQNHPILLHSNKGKHRVGVLVGCMRKVLQGWDLKTIEHEYSMFSSGKGELDLKFLKTFEPTDPALQDVKGWGEDIMKFPLPRASEDSVN